MLRLMLWLLMLRLVILLRLMLIMLMLRPALLVRLLIAPAVGLRIARRVGRLGVARRIRRRIAEVRLALLHWLVHAVVAIVEIVVAVVGQRFPTLGTIIGVLLAELFLRRGNQTKIMLGVLVIILGRYRVA